MFNLPWFKEQKPERPVTEERREALNARGELSDAVIKFSQVKADVQDEIIALKMTVSAIRFSVILDNSDADRDPGEQRPGKSQNPESTGKVGRTFIVQADREKLQASFLALIAAAIGTWKTWKAAAVSTNNALAIQSLDIKVDGRLTALLDKTTEVSRLIGREEMRSETDATAAALADVTKADMFAAVKDYSMF